MADWEGGGESGTAHQPGPTTHAGDVARASIAKIEAKYGAGSPQAQWARDAARSIFEHEAGGGAVDDGEWSATKLDNGW